MRIPLVVSAAGASAALLFAACSSASPTTTASNPAGARDASSAVLLSAQQSVNAGTAQVDVTAQLTLPVVGAETAKGNGAVDFDAQKAQAHLDAGGIQLDGVVDGDVAYLQSPLLGSDTWYKLDTTASNGSGLADAWARIVDPAQLFTSLQDASSSMTALGPEQVNGLQTTHYHGELDLAKSAPAGGNTNGSANVPVDVWVDGQGLVSRIQVAFSSSGGHGSTNSSGSGTLTVDLHDYGKPVTITVPPADQVKDLSDALGGLGSLFKGG